MGPAHARSSRSRAAASASTRSSGATSRRADLIDAQADPQTLTISYTVEYLHQDGHKSTDDVTLQLEGTDGDFLIAGES